MLKQQLLYSYI